MPDKNAKISPHAFMGGVIKFSISSWINFFISMISVIITTRLFAPDTFGLINIFNSASFLILGFICFGLDSSFIRFFNEPPDHYDRDKLLIVCMGIPVLLIVVMGIIVPLFFHDRISMYVFQVANRFITAMLFVNASSLVVIRYFTIYYRMANNPRMFTILSVLLQFFSKCFVIAAALFSPDYNTVIAFNTFGVFLFAGIFMLSQSKTFLFPLKNTFSHIITLLKYSKEIFLYAFYSWPVPTILYLNTFLSQLVITRLSGSFNLGVYASVNIFIGAISVLLTGFSNYWSGFMFANYSTEQSKIIKVHNYMLLFVIGTICSFVIFRDVVYLAIGSKYHDSKQFFILALIYPLLCLLAETTSYGVSISKKAHFTLLVMAVTAAINVGLCICLVPVMGISGAAVASALAGIIMFILQTVFGQKYYKSVENLFKTYGIIALICIVAGMNYFLYKTILSSILALGILILSLAIFRKELISIYELVSTTLRERKLLRR